jgi:hypothetical protein
MERSLAEQELEVGLAAHPGLHAKLFKQAVDSVTGSPVMALLMIILLLHAQTQLRSPLPL